jgi:signal peptidase I
MNWKKLLAAYTGSLFILGLVMAALRKKAAACTLLLITALLAGFLVFICLFSPYRVSGLSMYPAYHPGQIVFTEPYPDAGSAERGDVIVFHSDDLSADLIKRIEGLPGDKVQITEGKLFINGEVVEEGFDPMEQAGIAAFPVTLKEGEFFVLGDNRNDSLDSRELGPVPFVQIKGKVR